jgi:hypothetical protein
MGNRLDRLVGPHIWLIILTVATSVTAVLFLEGIISPKRGGLAQHMICISGCLSAGGLYFLVRVIQASKHSRHYWTKLETLHREKKLSPQLIEKLSMTVCAATATLYFVLRNNRRELVRPLCETFLNKNFKRRIAGHHGSGSTHVLTLPDGESITFELDPEQLRGHQESVSKTQSLAAREIVSR